jgi:ABC-2 type transport system ATP-binding protein
MNRTSVDAEQSAPGAQRSAAPVLAVGAVTKRWPRQPEPVLRGIDLEVRAGELAWVTGDNGAGKTTLLRVVAGIIAPDEGTIRVCGLEAAHRRRDYQRQIGLVTAGNSGVYARMTVRQHLDYWARLALVVPRHRPERVERSIELFGLAALAGRRMDRMSMGQRQRVRVAMAFLHEPALVLLDEPATSLDEDGIASLLQAVEAHRQAGGSALWCSPSGEEIGTRVDKRLRLVSGGLERHG